MPNQRSAPSRGTDTGDHLGAPTRHTDAAPRNREMQLHHQLRPDEEMSASPIHTGDERQQGDAMFEDEVEVSNPPRPSQL